MLVRRLAADKVKSVAALARVARTARARGRRIVFTNGCFDVLHPGHLALPEHARALGHLLIVGINSDRSVRRLKGRGRPMVPQRSRACMVAGLEAVDYVTVFNAATPTRLIQRLRPHVLVKGADWSANTIVGREIVEASGGRVVRVPLLRGQSSSRVIRRLRG